MRERTICFDGKCALMYYGLRLRRCVVTPAKRKQKWLDVPAMDGKVDLMETAGMICYDNRTLRAEFTACDNGGQSARRMIHELEGRRVRIGLPDRMGRYMVGVIHVSGAYLPGADVVVSATCLPWMYAPCECVCPILGSDAPREYRWRNNGGKNVVPLLIVGEGGVQITIGDNVLDLPAGEQYVPELEIPAGGIIRFTVSGANAEGRYREAYL